MEVGGFGVEMIMIQMHIDVQKYDLEEGMLSEFDRIEAVEASKELGKGVRIMRSVEEDIINKIQPKAGHLKSERKSFQGNP